MCAPGGIGQATRWSTICGHDIDFIGAFVATGKGNLPTIRRKMRPGGRRHASGQSLGAPTSGGNTPEVIFSREDNLIAIDCRKAWVSGGCHAIPLDALIVTQVLYVRG